MRLLNSFYAMHLRDEQLLEQCADMIRLGKISSARDLTQVLYMFAKFGWRSDSSDDYIQIALSKIM